MHRIADGIAYEFEVYNIAGWASDDGASLHTQEKGCGALTGWKFNAATSSSSGSAYFDLPFFIKSGCVERAIVSAGGPKLSCSFQGYIFPPPKKRQETTETTSLSYTPSYSYSSSYSSIPLYTPMTWPSASGNTVTFTWTYLSYSSTTITTTTVITNATTVPIPGNSISSSNVSVTATSSSSGPTSTVTPPGPTQSGITSNCDKYYVTQSGEYYKFTSTHKLNLHDANTSSRRFLLLHRNPIRHHLRPILRLESRHRQRLHQSLDL